MKHEKLRQVCWAVLGTASKESGEMASRARLRPTTVASELRTRGQWRRQYGCSVVPDVGNGGVA